MRNLIFILISACFMLGCTSLSGDYTNAVKRYSVYNIVATKDCDSIEATVVVHEVDMSHPTIRWTKTFSNNDIGMINKWITDRTEQADSLICRLAVVDARH